MLSLMVTRSCWHLAGACRNRTYPAPYEAELVLKTSRTTRPDPPPGAAQKLATRGPFLQLHAMNPDLRLALVCIAGLVRGRARPRSAVRPAPPPARAGSWRDDRAASGDAGGNDPGDSADH